MCHLFSLNRLSMSDRTRTRKIAPKAGNDYKQAELVAAAKDGVVKDVGLPEDMFPKSESSNKYPLYPLCGGYIK